MKKSLIEDLNSPLYLVKRRWLRRTGLLTGTVCIFFIYLGVIVYRSFMSIFDTSVETYKMLKDNYKELW